MNRSMYQSIHSWQLQNWTGWDSYSCCCNFCFDVNIPASQMSNPRYWHWHCIPIHNLTAVHGQFFHLIIIFCCCYTLPFVSLCVSFTIAYFDFICNIVGFQGQWCTSLYYRDSSLLSVVHILNTANCQLHAYCISIQCVQSFWLLINDLNTNLWWAGWTFGAYIMHDTNVGNSAGLDALQCGISCIVQNCFAHSIYIQQYYGERSMHKTRLKRWWPAWAKEKLVMPGFVVPSPVI